MTNSHTESLITFFIALATLWEYLIYLSSDLFHVSMGVGYLTQSRSSIHVSQLHEERLNKGAIL